jgi:hypothetical protein
MKELKKKVKKTAEFEKINYSAYHEEGGLYTASGNYVKGNGMDYYSQSGSIDQNDDDILF